MCENPHEHQFSRPTPALHTHSHKDYSMEYTHKHTDSRADIEGNSGVFVLLVLRRDEASAGNYDPRIPFICSTSAASIATAGTHTSSAGKRVYTQPTHSAQQQQHAAHHDGYHDGQLATTKLHFGDGAMKVPHLHLERKSNNTWNPSILLPLHPYLSMLKYVSQCHI